MLSISSLTRSKLLLSLTLVAVGSLTTLGYFSEVCDIAANCPSRVAYLVAAGVISFVLTAALIGGLLFDVAVVDRVAVYVCGFLALWWGITAGVASSPRTTLFTTVGGTLTVGLLAVWLAFLSAVAATAAAAVQSGMITGPTGGEAAPARAGGNRDPEKVRPGSESSVSDTPEVETAVPV